MEKTIDIVRCSNCETVYSIADYKDCPGCEYNSFTIVSYIEDKKPKPTDRETTWSKYLSQTSAYKGTAEYKTPDGSRIDIFNGEYAIEVEWCKKWPQAIGQAIFYSLCTGAKPAIILLRRDKPTEQKYYLRCLAVCSKLNIALSVVDTR